MYVYLVAIPQKRDKLTDSEIASVANLIKKLETERARGLKIGEDIQNALKFSAGVGSYLFSWFKDVRSMTRISYLESKEFSSKTVSLKGFAGPRDDVSFVNLKPLRLKDWLLVPLHKEPPQRAQYLIQIFFRLITDYVGPQFFKIPSQHRMYSYEVIRV